MAKYNPEKLTSELQTAGIQTTGCNTTGIVWGIDGAEIQDRPDVQAVLIAHDPIEYSITSDKAVIPADGASEAILTISSDPLDAIAQITINGIVYDISMQRGQATQEIASDTVGIMTISGVGKLAGISLIVEAV